MPDDNDDSTRSLGSHEQPTEPLLPAPPTPGQIGPYKILEVLGEGGMGIVYLAEQEKPIRRRVALKLIKLGMDTQQVIARFESERQALALMNHPNVAKVFDAGSTEQGRPYFVMEHVPGVPMTEYCDQNKLTNRQRLQLFTPVCEAIQHAHQKGIIHRDIKPSNVLVSLVDGKPIPKVIDFGVAKATGQQLTERTLFTRQGALVGTPEYMSPEQAGATGVDIDTRTDVYSLGVLLYELLVGALPFEPRRLRRAALDELLRIIREEEPSKPSDRVSGLGGTATTLASRRQSDVRSLTRQLRGDLDWITMRAIEKDRARRYSSVSEFRTDVESHLRDRPVQAGPPDAVYRLSKFVRRHKVGVSLSVGLGLTIIVGGAGSGIGLMRALRAEAQAKDAERLAKEESAIATEVGEFLLNVFEVSENWPESTMSARDLLDVGAARISRELHTRPLIRARVLEQLAGVFRSRGSYQRARLLLEEVLAVRVATVGPDHLDVARCLEQLALVVNFDEARSLMSRALEIRENTLGSDNLEIADFLSRYSTILGRHGDLALAIQMGERSLRIRERVQGLGNPDLVGPLFDIGKMFLQANDPQAAIGFFDRAVEIREKEVGTRDAEVAAFFSLVAGWIHEFDPEKATRLYERAVPLWKQSDHPELADCYYWLAVLTAERQDPELALDYLRQAVGTNWPLYMERSHFLVLQGNPEFESLFVEAAVAYRRSRGAGILLQDGVHAWNRWREEYPLMRPDLTFDRFDGAALENANLESTNLSNAYLLKANLRSANLAGACLEQANLDGADLSNAYLLSANLRGAHLIGARLEGAVLSGAIITQDQLDVACVNEATLLPMGLAAPPPCGYAERVIAVLPDGPDGE